MKPSAETLKKLKTDSDAVRFIYRAYDPDEDAPKHDEDDEDEEPPVCEACGGVSYVKRTGIFELLVTNDRIRELIQVNPDINEIRKVAAAAGMKTLFADGARLVIEGDTSIQELLRVAK